MELRSRCVTTLVATGILLAPIIIEGVLAVGDRSKLNRLAASRCVEDLLGFVHMDDVVEKPFTLYDANERRRERTIQNFMVVLNIYIVAFCRLYSG
jgi:hypothetical protein